MQLLQEILSDTGLRTPDVPVSAYETEIRTRELSSDRFVKNIRRVTRRLCLESGGNLRMA